MRTDDETERTYAGKLTHVLLINSLAEELSKSRKKFKSYLEAQMAKRSIISKTRKRKSNKEAFDSEEAYKRFAAKRNAATKRCRQRGNAERKVLREENARLREELELLRVERGLGVGGGGEVSYWRNKSEEMRKELKGEVWVCPSRQIVT